MSEIKINCMGETCPIPLVETRKAIRKAQPGDIIEVTGDHPASKKEIPMAVREMGLELLEVKDVAGGHVDNQDQAMTTKTLSGGR